MNGDPKCMLLFALEKLAGTKGVDWPSAKPGLPQMPHWTLPRHPERSNGSGGTPRALAEAARTSRCTAFGVSVGPARFSRVIAKSWRCAIGRDRVSRNGPCPCGSRKKYKHCCLPKEVTARQPRLAPLTDLHGKPKTHVEYPMGTMAFYGPNDKTTTKIAAGVFTAMNSKAIIKRWVATDVTTNPKIQREIMEFFTAQGVKSVAMSDGNMGCPREEGEDFPVGEDCPFCPFWKGKQGSNERF